MEIIDAAIITKTKKNRKISSVDQPDLKKNYFIIYLKSRNSYSSVL